MPTLTVRNLEPETHRAIRECAARNELSMEEQVRQVLKEKFNPVKETPVDIAKKIHARLQGFDELQEICNQPQQPISEPLSLEQ